MARRGSSSRGKSSGGRSSSSSRGRSSSKSSSAGRKSSARSTKSSSSGRTARKTTTSRPRRTTTTASPKARRATQNTAKATPRIVRRTAVVRTVSPPKPRRLTGIGRIAKPKITVKPQKAFTGFKSVGVYGQPRQVLKPTTLQQRATNFTQLMSGSGRPVTVTYANGQSRRMNLSDAAIRSYQQSGLKVQPISITYSGGQKYPTPAIPRINNPSQAWTDPQNQNQLHVTQQMRVKPNTRTNSNFGGLGANPWRPIEAIQGLFGISPQQQPESQWLPQRNENIINPDRPIYTAMTTGLQQAAAYEESPLAFQSQLMGSGAYNPTDISAGDRIKDLFQNQYVLYGGLAIGAIVVLKLILGGGTKYVRA